MIPSNALADQAPIFFTKIFHIFLTSIFIMFLGIFASKNLNDIYPGSKQKDTMTAILHVCIFTGLIYTAHYSIRNLLELINDNLISRILFWSESINYDTGRLKEIDGGIALAFAIFLYMSKYKYDIFDLFQNKINISVSSYLMKAQKRYKS